jgi:hypothetical protein
MSKLYSPPLLIEVEGSISGFFEWREPCIPTVAATRSFL